MKKNEKTLMLDNSMVTAERLIAGDGFGNYKWKGKSISGLLCTYAKRCSHNALSIQAFEAVDNRMLSASDRYRVEFKGYQVSEVLGENRTLAFVVSGVLSEIHMHVDSVIGIQYVFVIDPTENTIQEIGLEKTVQLINMKGS